MSPQTIVHATDGGSTSKTPNSADMRQETSRTELPLDSVYGREEELSKLPVPLSQPEVKDTSGPSESLISTTSCIEDIHPFTSEEQKKIGYKQEMKVLGQAGSLVRGSEDPHSPIWLEGVGYPAQYLVRQTRSMSAKMSTQSSDGESASRRKDSSTKETSSRDSCREESLLQHQHSTGGRVQGKRRRKGETSSLLSVQTTSLQTDVGTQPHWGYDNPHHSYDDLEDLRISIPICRKSPITVASVASQKESISVHKRFGTKLPLMKQLLFPQLSQKVSQLTTSPLDFFLPDEGFQTLKLRKLQSVHQLGGKRKLRRRSKPLKLASSRWLLGQDTGSSQSEFEFCTQEVDIPKQLRTCSPHSVVCEDISEQAVCSAPSGGKVPSKDTFVSLNPCVVTSNICGHSLHCTFVKMAGSEVVTTTELKHVTCLPDVSKVG